MQPEARGGVPELEAGVAWPAFDAAGAEGGRALVFDRRCRCRVEPVFEDSAAVRKVAAQVRSCASPAVGRAWHARATAAGPAVAAALALAVEMGEGQGCGTSGRRWAGCGILPHGRFAWILLALLRWI